MPELGLQRTPWVGQAEAQDAVWKYAVVAELNSARPEAPQSPLRLGERRPVIVFKQGPVVFGDAVELPGLVFLIQEPHGDGVTVYR